MARIFHPVLIWLGVTGLAVALAVTAVGSANDAVTGPRLAELDQLLAGGTEPGAVASSPPAPDPASASAVSSPPRPAATTPTDASTDASPDAGIALGNADSTASPSGRSGGDDSAPGPPPVSGPRPKPSPERESES
ncbi:MAG: hypothetical protein ACJA2H_001149, partial [Nitriliruptoraceae bacterium]